MLVEVGLLDEALWDRFNEAQNEMIITRGGRCLFPLLRLWFRHVLHIVPDQNRQFIILEPEHRYSIGLRIRKADAMRWRFRTNKWQPILSIERSSSSQSSQETISSARSVRGQTSPLHIYEPVNYVTTEELLTHGVSFAKVKLTNQPYEQQGGSLVHTSPSISLASFHRYIPNIYIFDHSLNNDTRNLSQVLIEDSNNPALITINFSMTNFIAVTHYQNEVVTLLKKNYNPHAKGFLPKSPSNAESTSDVSEDLERDEILATEILASMTSSPSKPIEE